MLEQTMSVREAADILKVKPRTIRDWIKHGRLPASRVGRFYLIAAKEIGSMINPTKESDMKAHAAAFRTMLRSGGKINKEAFIRDRQAEYESVTSK